MKKIAITIINFLLKVFKIRDNQIIFQSGRGKVDCAPYAIYKYIKSDCPDKYRCIWLVEKKTDVSMLQRGDYYYYNSIKGILALATSKYWIRSQSIGGIVKKKKGQVYIQVWHGAGNLKKCGYDCLEEAERPTETVEHAKEWSWLIATDDLNEKAMISSVGFKKKSLVLGNADTDLILENNNKKYIKHIKSKIGVDDEQKRVILYAPTFRDFDLNKDHNDINLPIMKLGELKKCLVLLRLHPLISEKMKNIVLPNNFINVGDYPNILDLYLVSDVLVTDYSSIIYPYMVLNKPLVLYPYDMEKYIKLRGGFYMNYEDMPGPICYSENELLINLKNIDDIKKQYKKKMERFNKKYNYLNDGQVCKRFVSKLKEGYFDK